MAIPLAAMARRTRKTRRASITFRPIRAPANLASDLYATVYAPVVQAWNEAVPAIMAAYSEALATITRDSPERVSATIGGVERQFETVLVTLRLRLEAWAARIERWHRAKWRAAVLTATGVDLATMLGPEPVRATLGTVIERNVALVKSVSDQARQRIADAVFRGLTQRTPAVDVAREVRRAVEMSRKRSLLIASDQLSKVTATLNSERQLEAGLEFYEWMHSGKRHPREVHKARDGNRYKVGHFGADEPGQAINCGCTGRAVLSLDREF